MLTLIAAAALSLEIDDRGAETGFAFFWGLFSIICGIVCAAVSYAGMEGMEWLFRQYKNRKGDN